MAPKGTRTRRTKAEVEQEFSAIAEELSEQKLSISSKESIAHGLQEASILDAVSGIAVEVIIHKLADLNTEISKSLSNLSERLANEVNLLHQVRSAIKIENDHLQQLHKIDVSATALDQLIEDYQSKKFQLDSEIQVKRAEWEKEKRFQEEVSIEYERTLKSARLRETEEYEYERNIERKKQQVKYQEECRLKEKQNQEKQEALEKSWQIREEHLKAQEGHLQELQKTVDTFPVRLEQEVNKAFQEGVKQTEYRLSQELLLLRKDKETEQRIFELKINSLEENVTQQSGQIAHLQKQLEEAKKEVKEIAEKAIEGASGAKTLSHINQIAIEQAKNRSTTN